MAERWAVIGRHPALQHDMLMPLCSSLCAEDVLPLSGLLVVKLHKIAASLFLR